MSLFSRHKKVKPDKIPPCSAIIAAAGLSERMNGEDKLFIELRGKPVIAHALTAFQNCKYINEIIVVSRGEHMELVSDICKFYSITKATKVVAGGHTRLASVYNGVFTVSEKAGLIAIHDGARPCIEQGVIESAIRAALRYHAVAPAVPVSSTIKRAKDGFVKETVDRDGLFEIQTPQVFTAELIKAALTNVVNKSIMVTDDCETVELIGAPVYLVEGSFFNIKLTTSEDIAVAEAILLQLGVKSEELGVRS